MMNFVASAASSSEEKPLRFENSVLLKMPKFSKGYLQTDIIEALEKFVDKTEIRVLGRLKYPNEWTMTLSSGDVRERLLQMSHFTVKGKKCVVYPQAENEVRGKIHWLPGEVDDEKIKDILRRFGEIVSFEKDMVFRSPAELRSSVRSFSLIINWDVSLDDIPHFITVCKCEGLLTVKGRDPMCLGCREHGHRKSNCPRSAKNANKSKKKPVEVDPIAAALSDSEAAKPKKKKRKHKKKSADNVPSVSATEVATIEESITSFIGQMNETLQRLRTVSVGNNQGAAQPSSSKASQSKVSPTPAVPSGSGQGNAASRAEVKSNIVPTAAGATGGSEQTTGKKPILQPTKTEPGVQNGSFVSAASKQVTSAVQTNPVRNAVSETVLISDGSAVNSQSEKSGKRKKNKKKKVSFSPQA